MWQRPKRVGEEGGRVSRGGWSGYGGGRVGLDSCLEGQERFFFAVLGITLRVLRFAPTYSAPVLL